MKQRLHFVSGLPLSGSTLPAEMSQRGEGAVFIDDARCQCILHGLFDNCCADGPAEVIFGTNRSWYARLPIIAEWFPEAKVIACVRHVSWIIDSIGRLVRKNAFSPSSIFNYSAGGTVYTRANGVAASEGMVGYACDAPRQAFYGEHASRLLLVLYETLVGNPVKVIAAICDFIGETPFAPDTSHVSYEEAREFGTRVGTPGLYGVCPEVAATNRKTLLSPDLFQRFEADVFWRDPGLNPNHVCVV